MTISEIYDTYRIPPQLRLHQLRVAAVAKILSQSIAGFNECTGVVRAMLLHDMGNIIKFDLQKFPEFLQPEGLDYWGRVQREFISKYGPDEHVATLRIAQEIGVSERIIDLISCVGFDKAELNKNTTDTAKKICAYSDQRVGPHGILSLAQRLEEGRKRYADHPKIALSSPEKYTLLSTSLLSIEKQIFSLSSIQPEDISDSQVTSVIEQGLVL